MDMSRSMAGNVIHSDQGAKDFGFQSAIVIGGMVYGWSVPAVLDVLGDEWLSNGWVSLTFRRPTYVGDELIARVVERNDGICDLTIQKNESETCGSMAV
jgi:acyl dehydratase